MERAVGCGMVGGLRQAFLRNGACGTEAQILERPVAVVPRARRSVVTGEPSVEDSPSCKDKKDLEAGIAELRRLLAVDCTVGSPPPNYFGVSPPVRSGAANPMPQDSRWRRESHLVSTRSLQTLHELDRSTHFLRSSASCAGDWRLLRVASPDPPSRSGQQSDEDAASSVCSVSVGSRGRRTPAPPRANSEGDLLLAF